LKTREATIDGKKLLLIKIEALRVVFRDPWICKYHDIWRIDGAMDKQALLAHCIQRIATWLHDVLALTMSGFFGTQEEVIYVLNTEGGKPV